MNTMQTLNTLRRGQSARIQQVCCTGALRRRLLELGIVENTLVRCLYRGPCGSPIAFCVCGTVIALREADAAKIAVCLCT